MQFDLTPEQRRLQIRARELARGPVAERAAEIDQTEQYPWDNVALLKEAGFFGMTIPVAYGGQGASYLDAVLVIEEMAKCCGVTGRIVVEANMGAIGAIMKYGSEAQKRLAADLVLSGDKPAICITEPGAGSAASEMTTRADRRGNGFVVNGQQALDHRRRRLAPAPGLRPRVRRTGSGGRDRRLYRDPRRDAWA